MPSGQVVRVGIYLPASRFHLPAAGRSGQVPAASTDNSCRPARTAATVTVSGQRGVLATAEAKLVERGVKYEGKMVVFDTKADGTNTLREIRFAGSAQAIVFYE